MNNDNRSNIFALIVAGFLTGGISLVDQAFISKSGSELLKMHVVVSFIPIILGSVAKTIGASLLVTYPKENAIYGNAVSFLLVCALFFCSGFALFDVPYLSAYNIHSSLSVSYYKITVSFSFLSMLCSFLLFTLLAKKRTKPMLISNAIIFGVNIVGNSYCYLFLNGEAKILGYAFSSLVSVSFAIVYLIKTLGFENMRELKNPICYIKRAKFVLGGDTLTLGVATITPISISYALTIIGRDTLIAPLGASNAALLLISLPSAALLRYFTGAASSARKPSKQREVYEELAQLKTKAALFPGLLLLALAYLFSPTLWGFEYSKEALFVLVACLRFLPEFLILPEKVFLQSSEKQIHLAKVDLIVFLTTLILIWFLHQSSALSLFSFSFALLLPKLVHLVLVKRLHAKYA